jgi:hypothetical protein
MVQPFKCYCGSTGCLGNIQGALHISNEVIAKYRVTDYIKQKLQNRQQ